MQTVPVLVARCAVRLSAIVATVGLAVATGCGSSTPKARTDTPEPARSPPAQVVPTGTVVGIGGEPEGMVIDETTGLVAIGVRTPDGVVIVGHDGGVVRRVPLSGAPRHLGLGNTARQILAPTEGSDELATIDVETGSVISTTPVGRQPHDAAAAAGRVFAGNELADSLSVIQDSKVMTVLPMPVQPGGVASNGRTVAVVGVRGRQMEVVEAATLRSLGRISSGVGPTHVVAGPDGRYYVADTQGEGVIVYEDRPKLARVGTTEAVGAPYGITVDAARKRLWVTLTARNQLVEYDISGRLPKRLATYPTVRQPNSVVVDAPTGTVFVAGATPTGQLQILHAG